MMNLAKMYVSPNFCSSQVENFQKMGRTSIARHLKAFRKSMAVFNKRFREKIGGEGKVVELDEALFGKRKNHRGRIPSG